MQIKLERLLEHMPLGLPVLLGNRNEFVVQLASISGVNFLVGGVGMVSDSPSDLYPKSVFTIYQYKT